MYSLKGYQRDNITTKCDGIVLDEKLKLMLCRWYVHDSNNDKNYLTNLTIVINNNELITKNVVQTIGAKEELNMFSSGDSQNTFFKPATRTIDKKEERSLLFRRKNGKEVHISYAQARTIVTLINMSLQGFSPVKLIDINLTDELGLYKIDEDRARLVQSSVHSV